MSAGFKFTTTPPSISPKVLDLCATIVKGVQPVYVPLRPHPESVVNECFDNVNGQVKKHGGKLIHGWAIWEWRNVWVEGEFHGVWESPEGELQCVSKRTDNETRLLFLPDHTRRYSGFSFGNKRLALHDDPLIHEFIRVNERLNGIQCATAPYSKTYSAKVGEIKALTREWQHLDKKLHAKYNPDIP